MPESNGTVPLWPLPHTAPEQVQRAIEEEVAAALEDEQNFAPPAGNYAIIHNPEHEEIVLLEQERLENAVTLPNNYESWRLLLLVKGLEISDEAWFLLETRGPCMISKLLRYGAMFNEAHSASGSTWRVMTEEHKVEARVHFDPALNGSLSITDVWTMSPNVHMGRPYEPKHARGIIDLLPLTRTPVVREEDGHRKMEIEP